MQIHKKVISNLNKCYSIAPLFYNEKKYFLVAAEKEDPCFLFDLQGNLVDTVWQEPGGVMSMAQIPGTNGQFLATHQFYSPNNSKEAKIVVVTPIQPGKWDIRTLAELPHVHRFEIVSRNGVDYLLACTLKSGHEYKEDWSNPGKVYAAVLPKDLSGFSQNCQLKFRVLKDNLLKNHGCCKIQEQGIESVLISAHSGIYQFTPPAQAGQEWEIDQILSTPASDGVLVDLDGDGVKELIVISPFHGDCISIYRKIEGAFQKVYEYEKKVEFAHGIYGGMLWGTPAVVIGHRKGERNLLIFRYDYMDRNYYAEIIDQDCGSANVHVYQYENQEFLISANREINQVAMYYTDN